MTLHPQTAVNFKNQINVAGSLHIMLVVVGLDRLDYLKLFPKK